jgi:4-carboxymuconolactone decarboxylase
MQLPADIYPESRNRLPLVQRDDLDEAGKKTYDAAANDPRSLVGLRGPGGIRLHDPKLNALSQPLNRYLRFDGGLDRKLAEIAILATARELEAHFEWCAHERAALMENVPADLIDIIRLRGSVDGLPDAEATMITLVREAVGGHRVSSPTFAAALRLFGKEPLLRYVSLIGNYMGTAVLLTVFDQQLPEGHAPTF